MIRQAVVLAVVIGGVVGLSAQTPEPAASAFEVASIKPRVGERAFSVGPISPDRFYRPDVTLKSLLQFAYDLREFQLDAVPKWVQSERWSVDAKAAGPQRPAEMRRLVRRLLADRFELQAHIESRELATYQLVRSRRDGSVGPNITPSSVDCRPFLDGERPREEPPREELTGLSRCSNGGRASPGEFTPRFNGQPMSAFARLLEPMVGRRVIDRTNLEGSFDIQVTFSDDAIPGLPPLPSGLVRREAPSLFTALDEQLGLKLEPARGPVEMLVIDSVERPTPD